MKNHHTLGSGFITVSSETNGVVPPMNRVQGLRFAQILPSTSRIKCRQGQRKGHQILGSSSIRSLADDQWEMLSKDERHSWLRDDLHLVLVHPVIPQNVGNISRTCAATGIGLHLVGPLGFSLDSSKLKRAGLDYWPYVAVKTHESWEVFHDFYQSISEPKRLIGFSKFASKHFASEGLYRSGDWLVFGAETTGLPEEVHKFIPESGGHMVKIPMRETHVRSLNLAVSVGIGAFEAIRQIDGPNF